MKDPANPLGPAAVIAARGRRMRVARLHSQRPAQRPPREQLDTVLSEDEAVERLYGERTGTVSASTSRPPLAPAGRTGLP